MTGGGTAGHVTANLALAEPLKAEGFTCMYLGMKKGIEYKLATQAGLPFRPVTSGRLHRNLNPDTLLLPFRVIKGTVQAVHWIRKEKPCLIFCKGGFVSWPVAAAGAMTHTTVILHESDMTPGLSNKLCVPFAKRVLTTFQDTVSYLPKDKALYTGTPIRASLTKGSREKGVELTGLDPDGKPVLMVIGGSSGAKALNDAVKDNLDTLLESFQIIHLYGSKNAFEAPKKEGYFSLAYASSELPDLYACADLALSRAGSNVINELLLLKIPALLVPLPLVALSLIYTDLPPAGWAGVLVALYYGGVLFTGGLRLHRGSGIGRVTLLTLVVLLLAVLMSFVASKRMSRPINDMAAAGE